jgi:hypothetical protein
MISRIISNIFKRKYFRKIIAILFLAFLFSCSVFSQVTDTADYFPLHVGDKWWYYVYGLYDSYKLSQVTGTLQIGDTTYYIVDNTYYYRKDSIGNVYKRLHDLDQLYFNIHANVSDKWLVYDGERLYYMKLSYNDLVYSASFGNIQNCKAYGYIIYYPQISDANKSYLLAPEIGIAHYFGEPSIEEDGYLNRAMLNNKFIGGPFSVLIYPIDSSGSRTYSGNTIDVNSGFFVRFNSDIDSGFIIDKFKFISKKSGEIKTKVNITTTYFSMKAYIVYPSIKLQQSDTITFKILGDLKDIYDQGFDGNKNGIYEGSPTDDCNDIYYTEPVTGIGETETVLDNFVIHQNYPNPFNNETILNFSIPEKGFVDANIYNILGQKVKTISLGEIEMGDHQIVWNAKNNDGKNIVSGIYIIQIKWKNKLKTIQTLYLK